MCASILATPTNLSTPLNRA